MYSAPSAVLLNELLKGTISISIAYYNSVVSVNQSLQPPQEDSKLNSRRLSQDLWNTSNVMSLDRLSIAANTLRLEIFSLVLFSSLFIPNHGSKLNLNSKLSWPIPALIVGNYLFQLSFTLFKIIFSS
jgi:hypothetical protein